MTNIRQRNYHSMKVAGVRHEKNNFLLGMASEIEKPVQAVFKSFWNVLTSPVEAGTNIR